jgi:DNA-binding NarL/FixJ family response regulator
MTVITVNVDPVRLGIVDDHPAIAAGVPSGLGEVLALAPGVRVATTVTELIEAEPDLDVVLLDIRLQDDSTPADNVKRLVNRGWPVLLYTQVSQVPTIAVCLAAGAMGVVAKHEDWSVLADAIRSVIRGEDHLTADWAAALEHLAAERPPALAPREAQGGRLYAAGLPLKSVARRLGVAEDTAKEYLTRAKRKYSDVGRPVSTRTDLYLRAVEDGLLDSERS